MNLRFAVAFLFFVGIARVDAFYHNVTIHNAIETSYPPPSNVYWCLRDHIPGFKDIFLYGTTYWRNTHVYESDPYFYASLYTRFFVEDIEYWIAGNLYGGLGSVGVGPIDYPLSISELRSMLATNALTIINGTPVDRAFNRIFSRWMYLLSHPWGPIDAYLGLNVFETVSTSVGGAAYGMDYTYDPPVPIMVASFFHAFIEPQSLTYDTVPVRTPVPIIGPSAPQTGPLTNKGTVTVTQWTSVSPRGHQQSYLTSLRPDILARQYFVTEFEIRDHYYSGVWQRYPDAGGENLGNQGRFVWTRPILPPSPIGSLYTHVHNVSEGGATVLTATVH